MNRILAIDPGNGESGFVLYDVKSNWVSDYGIFENKRIAKQIVRGYKDEANVGLAIEMIASYGMPVGKTVFETCLWIGRFIEAWGRDDHTLVYRREVKQQLCGNVKAKDANVRQVLIDMFGPGKQKAIGTKKHPGPLYGIKSHMWAALGVAVTCADKMKWEKHGSK